MKNQNLKISICNDNPIYNLITANALQVAKDKGIELFFVSEQESAQLIKDGVVDIALLTPLTYGQFVKNIEYRVLPANSLFSEGYSELGTIYLKPNLKNIKRTAIFGKNTCISVIAKLMLVEKFNIQSDWFYIEENDILDGWENKYDCLITPKGKPIDGFVQLDISDEWELLCEQALPIAFWCCKQELTLQNPELLLNLFAKDYHKVEINIEDESEPNPNIRRTGRLFTAWDKKAEESINFTLEFLYYHQIFSEMPSIKIFDNTQADDVN